jgi:Putative addiction module component
VESIQEPSSTAIQKTWDQEIANRVAAYDRGETETFSATGVFAEAKRIGCL